MAPSANSEQVRVFLIFSEDDALILVHVKQFLSKLLLQCKGLNLELKYLWHVTQIDSYSNVLIRELNEVLHMFNVVAQAFSALVAQMVELAKADGCLAEFG